MKGEAAAARHQTRPIKKTGESLRNAGKQERKALEFGEAMSQRRSKIQKSFFPDSYPSPARFLRSCFPERLPELLLSSLEEAFDQRAVVPDRRVVPLWT